MSEAPPHDPIRSWIAPRIESGIMVGGSWWVEGPAGVVSRGAEGCKETGPGGEPATETTPYDLASLTKPLCTALLAVLLEGDGQLDLDAPVGELLTEFGGSPFAGASLLELGTHRAGLPAWRPLYLEASSLEGYLRRIARQEAVAPRPVYSDLGYIALGAVLERVTGRPLDRLFEERIAAPLRLGRIGFALPGGRFADAAPTEVGNAHERRLCGEAAGGFRFRSELIRGEVHDVNAHVLGGVAGHAGLFGSATEVATLAREILHPRELPLARRGRERLLRPSEAGGERTFGWVTARGSEAARGVLPDDSPGHVGFTGTSLWLDPAAGAFYVLLTNRVHPEVGDRDFQVERRQFHRIAASLS